MHTRDDCIAMDQADGLGPLRAEFALPPNVIYLDGNSLGAQPRQALACAHGVVSRQWGNDLIGSWNSAGWFDLPTRLGGLLAPLIGAAAQDVAVTDTTSVNLFKALAGALKIQSTRTATPARKVIVTERSNFPSDIYIAQGLTQWLDQGYQLRLVDGPEALPNAIDQDVAVVVLTHVNYRSGYLLDMPALTRHAHDQGALVVWDLAHSAGAVPVDLTGSDADMAVGCTYKYLNGGPGSPAFIWIAPRHQDAFANPLSGWWAHARPFAMQPDYVPAAGIRKALCGTQPIVSLALVEAGLAVFAQTTMAAIRQKSLALTDLFIELIARRCASHPVAVVTPRDHAHRGSHVSITHPQGYAVVQALIERGVIGDYREPDIMRFGFTPLYTRYVDVWDAVEALVRILDGDALKTDSPRLVVT